jgi:hypothetical protein
MTSMVPNSAASLSNTARTLRRAVGQLLVEDLLAGRGEPMPLTEIPADVQAEEEAHVVDVGQTHPPKRRSCGAGQRDGAVRTHPHHADVPPARGRALHRAGR